MPGQECLPRFFMGLSRLLSVVVEWMNHDDLSSNTRQSMLASRSFAGWHGRVRDALAPGTSPAPRGVGTGGIAGADRRDHRLAARRLQPPRHLRSQARRPLGVPRAVRAHRHPDARAAVQRAAAAAGEASRINSRSCARWPTPAAGIRRARCSSSRAIPTRRTSSSRSIPTS